MAKKAIPISVAVASAIFSISASAVEFHGYARAGLSTTSDGGEQTCYGSGAAGHFVGRLGDECDTYAEIDLQQELYNKDDQSLSVEAMWAYDAGNQGNDYQTLYSAEHTGADDRSTSEPWGGGEIALRQLFVQGKGLLNFAPEATLWAGKRYYQRHDVHILDLFHINNSGYGAGVEGISTGPGSFSFAVTNFDTPSRIDGTAGEPTIQNNKLDLRYAGIPLWSGATLELVGIYGMADLTDAQEAAGHSDDDGFFFTAEISHPLKGGFNKIVVQYATDSMGHGAWANHGGGESLNAPWWGGHITESWRIMDYGVIKLSENTELGFSALYQEGEPDDSSVSDTLTKLSVVARPVFQWSDVMSTAVEIGYSKDEGYPFEGDNGDHDLAKIMVAQQWSAGRGFWARPQIRLYAGSFFGDDAEARDDDGNFRIGAQIEAWW